MFFFIFLNVFKNIFYGFNFCVLSDVVFFVLIKTETYKITNMIYFYGQIAFSCF